eukprot:gene16285-22182_t
MAHGRIKWLVLFQQGIFRKVDESLFNQIVTSSCHRGHQIFHHAGKEVITTQNCFSWGGALMLVHKDENILNDFYAWIGEIEKNGLFHIDDMPIPPAPTLDKAVAIVDPFSTGALIASDLYKDGYKIIAIYSSKLEQLANLQNLVPQGLTLAFASVIPFDDDLSIICDQIIQTKSSSYLDIKAIIAGAETGVELADQLSEVLNLRTNGTTLSEARRNKYVMGETIRAAGIRAVKQFISSSLPDIDKWINEWNPTPFKVIVKPVDSAGSDGVTLCTDLEQVQLACMKMIGKVNGLGIINKAVLIQEYLEGQEYVVDIVSKDGVHKVVALWAYDRRAANGAGFVCFGQRPLLITDPNCMEIVEYQKKVITALGIMNGPTHGEVKWFNNEPVLVEVGARCHGAEGAWQVIVKKVYGYDQVKCTIDAYLHPELFEEIPSA